MPNRPVNIQEAPLAGLVVMVTRPAHQAENLCRLLSQAGATPLVFPVLEILDPVDPSALNPLIERLDDFDWAIFISPNAVEKAVNLIHARRDLPGTLKLATIGKGSAKALQKMIHRPPDLCPKDQFNSEALLAMPELQDVRGQRIVIFRGDGGREYLADTLRARGAQVEYANTYRRARPNADTDQLQRQWARDGIDVITISSGDGLRNLFDMVGNLAQNWLRQTQLVVVNERLVGLVNELGFARPPLVANEASDEAIVDAICRWRKTKNQDKNQESRNPV
jgi:uroporphyrinogen-III synthase